MTQTRQNRIQSFAFTIGVFLAFCFSFSFTFNLWPDESDFGHFHIVLNSRLNPNNAPIESLVRLPGLGIGRAGAIVDFRENFSDKKAASPVFQNCDDLQKVKGIGPKTVQNISEWLKFD